MLLILVKRTIMVMALIWTYAKAVSCQHHSCPCFLLILYVSFAYWTHRCQHFRQMKHFTVNCFSRQFGCAVTMEMSRGMAVLYQWKSAGWRRKWHEALHLFCLSWCHPMSCTIQSTGQMKTLCVIIQLKGKGSLGD